MIFVRSMSKLMEDQTDDWVTYLSSAVFATNTSIQNSTKYTPFLLMYGREARFPLEAEKVAEIKSLEEAVDDICTADTDKYIKEIMEKQKSIFSKTDTNIKLAQEKQKKQYAKRKGITEYGFEIGDKVLRRNMQQKTRKGKKMEDRWLGPYTIIEITKTSCSLKNSSGKVLKQRINLSQLKPYRESDDPDPVLNTSEENSCNSQTGNYVACSIYSYVATALNNIRSYASHLAVCTAMCMHPHTSNCINSTEFHKDLDASGSNESDRSVWESFESSTPTSVNIHSPTPQISPILEQEEGVIGEDTDCSDTGISV